MSETNDLSYIFYENARLNKDATFDGLFFTAVKTTKIYCRPTCPARRPNRNNVCYFHSAAEAEKNGYRPCLICKPENSPFNYSLSSEQLYRTLKLLNSGTLKPNQPLAARLMAPEDTIHSQFSTILGVSVVEYSNTHKRLLAKKLIDETTLKAHDIAIQCGYNSLQALKDDLEKTYKNKNHLIQKLQQRETNSNPEVIRLKLAYRPPYNWNRVLHYLQPRLITGVEHIDATSYYRTFCIANSVGHFNISHLDKENSLLLEIQMDKPLAIPEIIDRVQHQFDLFANPKLIYRVFKDDNKLQSLIKNNQGVRVPGCWDGYELSIRAIAGQQVSVQAASTVTSRIAAEFGETVAINSELKYLFPSPEKLASAQPECFSMPRARAQSIIDFSQAIVDGKIAMDSVQSASLFIDSIQKIKGIGPWTANYIAMRHLKYIDAFPQADLGLLKALNLSGKNGKKHLLEYASHWKPFRSYATFLLWNSLATTP